MGSLPAARLRQGAVAFHPDVEWDGTNLPDGKISHGHEAMLDHTALWANQWESWTVELGEFRDAGDDVVVFIHERGRSKSGIDMDERHAEIYTVKAGIIVRRRGFSDRAEALEAVGLREWAMSPSSSLGESVASHGNQQRHCRILLRRSSRRERRDETLCVSSSHLKPSAQRLLIRLPPSPSPPRPGAPRR